MPVLNMARNVVRNNHLGLYGPFRSHHSVSTDCGNTFSNGGIQADSTDCNIACTGNAQEICGAAGQSFPLPYSIDLTIGLVDRLNVYWSGVPPPSSPITVPNDGL